MLEAVEALELRRSVWMKEHANDNLKASAATDYSSTAENKLLRHLWLQLIPSSCRPRHLPRLHPRLPHRRPAQQAQMHRRCYRHPS